MALINEATIRVLSDLAKKGFNVLLTATHGVGKTTIVKQIAHDQQLSMKYYSASTLDPWADVVGIPVPNRSPEVFSIIKEMLKIEAMPEQQILDFIIRKDLATNEDNAKIILEYVKTKSEDHLDFLRPEDLGECEWLVFDEINRAHPKVQNAILELVQFQSINGVPLPKLKMVWGMQNPPGGVYKVVELDPALLTRFHSHWVLEGRPSAAWFISQGITESVANAVVSWWTNDLNDTQKADIPPRVLQHICELVCAGFDAEQCLLSTYKVPTALLKNRLRDVVISHTYQNVQIADICRKPLKFVDLAKKPDHDFCTYFCSLLLNPRVRGLVIVGVIPVIMAMPNEFIRKLVANSAFVSKMYKRCVKEYASLPDWGHKCVTEDFKTMITNATPVQFR